MPNNADQRNMLNPTLLMTPKDSQLQSVIDKIREHQHLALFDVNKSSENDIGRFGLKTAEDVKTFLKSPKAQAEINRYAIELSISKELLQETLFEMLMRQLLRMFLLAAHRHAKDNKKHKQQELNQAYAEQIEEQKIKQHKKAEALLSHPEHYMQSLDQYDADIHAISKQIEHIQLEQQQLENQIVDLNQAIVEIENRYSSHHHHLETVARLFDNPETTPNSLEQYLDTIGVKIENFNQGIGAMLATPNLVMGEAQQQPILEQQGLMMHAHAVRSHLDVLSGTHRYIDHEGNALHHQTGFRNAAFIVPVEERIHRHNNELLLVPTNTLPEEMSEAERQEAKQRLKPMQTLRTILAQNQSNELNLIGGNLQNIVSNMQSKQTQRNDLQKSLQVKMDSRNAFVNQLKPLLVEGLNTFDNRSSTEKMLNEFSRIPRSPLQMTPSPKPKAVVAKERAAAPLTKENLARLVASLPAANGGNLNKVLEQINRMNNAPTPFSMKPY